MSKVTAVILDGAVPEFDRLDKELVAAWESLHSLILTQRPSREMVIAIKEAAAATNAVILWYDQELRNLFMKFPEVMEKIRSMQASDSGKQKGKRDPVTRAKSKAMEAIRSEWKRRKDAGQRFTAVSFAREMARKNQAVTLEAIKNAQTRWNKEYHPAS